MPELTYREAVRDTLVQAMRADDDVFIMGEDIAEMGGSMGVTQGLLDEFGPERVRNTPISEMALAGTAIGAAMQGMRPVAEIMYEDFMTLAAEQVVNQAAKLRYMSGGQLTVPVVFRTQGGAGWSPGAQHAQQLEAWFVHIPGLKVVFPSTPSDVPGMSIRSVTRFPSNAALNASSVCAPAGEAIASKVATASPRADGSIEAPVKVSFSYRRQPRDSAVSSDR